MQNYKGHTCKDPCILKTDEGKKLDDGKNRLDLISPAIIEELGRVLTMGSVKYGDRNWELGIDYNRVYGAALRHFITWWGGEDTDDESGLSHLSHCACNLMFLIEFMQNPEKYGKFDNRPTYKVKKAEVAKAPGVPVTAYLSHSIRGGDGNNAAAETMEANMAKARVVTGEIRKRCGGKIDLYVPAEQDMFVQIAWKDGLITDKQILDVDCKIIKKKDLLIAYNYDGSSQGMVKEVNYAIDNEKAIAYISDSYPRTDALTKCVCEMYKEKNQCVSS